MAETSTDAQQLQRHAFCKDLESRISPYIDEERDQNSRIRMSTPVELSRVISMGVRLYGSIIRRTKLPQRCVIYRAYKFVNDADVQSFLSTNISRGYLYTDRITSFTGDRDMIPEYANYAGPEELDVVQQCHKLILTVVVHRPKKKIFVDRLTMDAEHTALLGVWPLADPGEVQLLPGRYRVVRVAHYPPGALVRENETE